MRRRGVETLQRARLRRDASLRACLGLGSRELGFSGCFVSYCSRCRAAATISTPACGRERRRAVRTRTLGQLRIKVDPRVSRHLERARGRAHLSLRDRGVQERCLGAVRGHRGSRPKHPRSQSGGLRAQSLSSPPSATRKTPAIRAVSSTRGACRAARGRSRPTVAASAAISDWQWGSLSDFPGGLVHEGGLSKPCSSPLRVPVRHVLSEPRSGELQPCAVLVGAALAYDCDGTFGSASSHRHDLRHRSELLLGAYYLRSRSLHVTGTKLKSDCDPCVTQICAANPLVARAPGALPVCREGEHHLRQHLRMRHRPDALQRSLLRSRERSRPLGRSGGRLHRSRQRLGTDRDQRFRGEYAGSRRSARGGQTISGSGAKTQKIGPTWFWKNTAGNNLAYINWETGYGTAAEQQGRVPVRRGHRQVARRCQQHEQEGSLRGAAVEDARRHTDDVRVDQHLCGHGGECVRRHLRLELERERRVQDLEARPDQPELRR